MAPPLWIPSKERINNSNMTSFMKYVAKLKNKNIDNYDQLYNWSVDEIEEFWKSIWIQAGIIHSNPYNNILSKDIMPGAKWFEGAKLNFAENLLRYKDDEYALISIREDCPAVKITYKELYNYVSSVARSFKKMGVGRGDRVAGYVSNIPEAVIGMLAATSLGAIWSSCSPDFGLKGILDRFGQIHPKILLAVQDYNYNGKNIDCKPKIKQIEEKIPSLEHIILISYDSNLETKNSIENNFNKNDKYINFNQLLTFISDKIDYNYLPFDHPVYIMYSSGTTGVPKCIVHGAGGTLLQHFKELSLHTNLTRHDKIMYFTTCGWMMWNWLISSLMIGAAVVLYDGSPIYPNMNFLWRKIDEEKITVFGTSPKFLSICEKAGNIPKQENSLNSLKTILSTGSPLSDQNFKWVYENVKSDVQLSSISGGTDIISCFMLGNPNLPVYPGEIQCRGLGMKVEAFDERGNSVVGEKGELVCTKPFPSMPIYFWDDLDNSKYRSAYFDDYPGVWKHGDFIKITKRGSVVMYGRSDATLNPGGVRIGTAEIYRIVEAMDEITDSIVIGQNVNNDVKVVLFVVLKDEIELTNALMSKIKQNIKEELTPRHVPSRIIQIKEVPRTISGKKVELAVSRIINGEVVSNQDVLANPDSLKQFEKIRETL